MPRSEPSSFVLDEVLNFTASCWWGPEEHQRTLTMLYALSHVKDSFSAVPHVLATSNSPGTGKTTATTSLPLMLASKPWRVSKSTTEYSLLSKWQDRNSAPDAILADDVSKTFGEGGTRGTTSRLYQLLIDCYLSTGTVSLTVNRVAKDVPAYAMAFMNGLDNAVPRDLADRAIELRLKPKPPKVRLQDALSPGVQAEGEILREALHGWARSHAKEMKAFMKSDALRVHPLLTDRTLQKWGPLFAIAHVAGGDWPRACMSAFQMLGLDASERVPLLPWQQALLDTAKVIMDAGVDKVFTAELVPALRELPYELYEKADDDYLVNTLLPKALGPSRELKGVSLSGRRVHGKGRLAAPILMAAADLRDSLAPQPPAPVRDALQDELTLSEA